MRTPASSGKAQAERLAPTIQVRDAGITSFGSVADTSGYSSNARRSPSSITYVMDNTGGATRAFIIGDPKGLVAGKTGAAYIQPTGAQGMTVAALQGSYDTMPVLVGGINYNTTTGAAQFAQNFEFAEADINKLWTQNIFSNEAERNTAQNPNLLTLQFRDAYELDSNSAFIITVLADEVVTLTLFISAAAGR